jgi:hypothetical protein
VELLEQAEGTLRRWTEVAERAWREGGDIAEALSEHFASDVADVPAEHRVKLETLNGVHSNAAGMRRWLEHRHEQGPA